jgi:cytochrome c-type biogenesis protein CcmF
MDKLLLPEYGHIALIAGFFVAIVLSVVPLLGTGLKQPLLMRSSYLWASLLTLCITLAIASLAYAFWSDDFSVEYVARNSNLELPPYYKLSALWSAHEGSLLLWVWLLSLWLLALVIFARKLPLEIMARVLAVMGMIAAGFLSFMLFTSNPFTRYLPFSPRDGSDLNPLLQDIGLIIHPPTLYMGYVGFSVAFAFAIAALLKGKVDAEWSRWTRTWTLAAWIFLTLGIMLGSWWSYAELGWGGWWFWDPVENASFMPWLAGTALLHSLAATEKRGVFKSWTLLLAIFAFSLSLLGTFLVRSGVLTSVHAFASDPARGYFILAFLVVVVGGSLTLYAFRAPQLQASPPETGDHNFALISKEMMLLLNNLLLVVILLVVLIGTLYPLVADALHLGKISVGPPYFNFFFVPLMAVLLLALPFGMMLKWKRDTIQPLKKRLVLAALLSVMAAVIFSLSYGRHFEWQGLLAVAVCSWTLLLILLDILHQCRHAPTLLSGMRKLSPSYKGMMIAHFGLVLATAGMALTSIYSESNDVRMDTGKPVSLASLSFVLNRVTEQEGPNYTTDVGDVSVFRGEHEVTHLHPEKRSYHSDRSNRMTEAAIDIGWFADIYVSMGEPLDKENIHAAWAMRLHYKPFVRWIWFGAIVMALGGLVSIRDRRYRR